MCVRRASSHLGGGGGGVRLRPVDARVSCNGGSSLGEDRGHFGPGFASSMAGRKTSPTGTIAIDCLPMHATSTSPTRKEAHVVPACPGFQTSTFRVRRVCTGDSTCSTRGRALMNARMSKRRPTRSILSSARHHGDDVDDGGHASRPTQPHMEGTAASLRVCDGQGFGGRVLQHQARFNRSPLVVPAPVARRLIPTGHSRVALNPVCWTMSTRAPPRTSANYAFRLEPVSVNLTTSGFREQPP